MLAKKYKNFRSIRKLEIENHAMVINYISLERACFTQFKKGLRCKIGQVILEKIRVKVENFVKMKRLFEKKHGQKIFSENLRENC